MRLERGRRHRIELVLNRTAVHGEAEPRMLLSDFLRHVLGARGTHVGCEHGVCGACTVRIDGALARSCLVLAVQVDGSAVETVEGLAPPLDPRREGAAELSVLQSAFRRNHALQCGFCTPGILVSLHDFLSREPDPSAAQIREVLGGHLCRCTGYTPIVRAALEAAAELRGAARKDRR